MDDEYDFADAPAEVDYYDGNYGSPTDSGVGGDYGTTSDVDYYNGNYGSPTAGGVGGNYGSGSSSSSGALSSLIKSLGLTGKDGSIDWAKILGIGGAVASLAGGQAYKPRSPAELLGSIPSNTPAFTPQAMTPMRAGAQLPTQSAASMISTVQPGRRYAEGGPVMEELPPMSGDVGPLSAMFQGPGLVHGVEGGQSDVVPAQLSPGEYVVDAESVSMLGDGNNDAGAQRLDELRASLRAHKRDAPDDAIAPPALGPLAYLKGGPV